METEYLFIRYIRLTVFDIKTNILCPRGGAWPGCQGPRDIGNEPIYAKSNIMPYMYMYNWNILVQNRWQALLIFSFHNGDRMSIYSAL